MVWLFCTLSSVSWRVMINVICIDCKFANCNIVGISMVFKASPRRCLGDAPGDCKASAPLLPHRDASAAACSSLHRRCGCSWGLEATTPPPPGRWASIPLSTWFCRHLPLPDLLCCHDGEGCCGEGEGWVHEEEGGV